ncbi:histidine phosphatase family protein [Rhizobium sp. ARZ01]|uniref:SixA phosphatase family protein n=1 Tax=Rhizobium sp. ARZ01 TaxID=2769313 RepID=UPI001785911B|nr:histidine phosphatase family protein [Rhizobium sp. ARZ01]MBD9374699.1 histidine phosphatase family protein [Rhizobium sp. ARZ01]
MTSRRLILLRHAKSAWPDGVADQKRPLAPRGQKAAPVMGAYLARERLVPDLVLVSTARRTQDTWNLMAPDLPKGIERRDIAAIYEAPPNRLLDVVRDTDADVRCLMLVGHNPGLQQLALALVGAGEADAIHRLGEKYPTAGLVVFDFSLELWSDLHAGTGTLERFVTPKRLV